MLYYLLTFLYVLVCVFLLLVVLLQQGKGGDIANAFGGGSSQTAFGARGGATLLSKITAVFAALFMIGALALAIIGQRGPSSSIMEGTPEPPAPAAAPAATPAAPGATPATTPAAPGTSATPAAPPAGTTAAPAAPPATAPAGTAAPAQTPAPASR